jgi:hypothetical protein
MFKTSSFRGESIDFGNPFSMGFEDLLSSGPSLPLFELRSDWNKSPNARMISARSAGIDPRRHITKHTTIRPAAMTAVQKVPARSGDKEGSSITV